MKENPDASYYLGKFHFWIMVAFWDFEIIRVFSYFLTTNALATFEAVIGYFKFDIVLLILTTLSLIFAIPHLSRREDMKFAAVSFFISLLFFSFMLYGYFGPYNDSEQHVYESILELRNFFAHDNLAQIDIKRIGIGYELIAVALIALLLFLMRLRRKNAEKRFAEQNGQAPEAK